MDAVTKTRITHPKLTNVDSKFLVGGGGWSGSGVNESKCLDSIVIDKLIRVFFSGEGVSC